MASDVASSEPRWYRALKSRGSYFREAPKLMRFLFVPCDSASLSSSFCFLPFLLPLLVVADVGVAPLLSLNDVDWGVGA